MANPETQPLVLLVHAVPGRTRLRVAWLPWARRAGDRSAISALLEAIARAPGVRKVAISAATGSVVCEHDQALAAAAVQEAVERAAAEHAHLAPPVATGGSRATVARELSSLLHQANERLLAITEGRLDLGTFASLGLFGASAVQIVGQGRLPFPRWSDLAWWSTQTFATFEEDRRR